MGYVVTPPSGIITLPANATYANVESLRQRLEAYPQRVMLPPPDPALMGTSTPPDLFAVLPYALVSSVFVLVGFILWLFTR